MSISSLGETRLIDQLRLWLGDASPPAPEGIGDDCAVLPGTKPGSQQLVTADPIIYGRHFDDTVSPEQAAAKLLRRNLSDIAAMGGVPSHAVVSLALDSQVSISWIKPFYTELAVEAKANGVKIVGGDVSGAPNFLGAFLTLYGETIPDCKPLLRHSSIVGSPLFVTGTLGGTRLNKHFSFTPRIAEGQWLSKSGACLTCCDLSDGLGKDYRNVTPADGVCEIDCSKIPISPDALQEADKSKKNPLYHVFNDGEDFELLFAMSPDIDIEEFESKWKSIFSTQLSHIGFVRNKSIESTSQLELLNAPNSFQAIGYEHLGKA